jgi:hypothetical protein
MLILMVIALQQYKNMLNKYDMDLIIETPILFSSDCVAEELFRVKLVPLMAIQSCYWNWSVIVYTCVANTWMSWIVLLQAVSNPGLAI